MGIRWLWALGAVACILFGVVWASAENPAAYPGLRAWLEWLIDWLNKNGDAVTALAAIIALLFGIVQVLAARADTREATAKAIWKDYHLHGIQYSELANPDFPKLDYEKEEYNGDRGKFYDYQWFVSLMLLACDEVLRLRGGSDWERIVKNNIRYHLPYINSGKPFQESEEILSDELRRKIDEVRKEKKKRRQVKGPKGPLTYSVSGRRGGFMSTRPSRPPRRNLHRGA